MASLPMLVLTAQVGTSSIGRGALQEAAGEGRTFSQTQLLSAVTKYSTMVTHASKLPETLRGAIRIAMSGRPGPVHLDLPADTQRGQIEDDVRSPDLYRPRLATRPVEPDLKRAAECLAAGKKVAILVGAGGRKGNSPLYVRRIAELLGCPVATSLPGKGALPEDHDLALGCIGLYGTRAANSYMRSGLDTLLVVGASLHEFTTHVWDPALRPTGTLIQVDLDASEIGKNYPVDIGLLGDSEEVLAGLWEQVSALVVTPRPPAEDFVGLKARMEYFSEPAMASTSIPLKPQRVMAELGKPCRMMLSCSPTSGTRSPGWSGAFRSGGRTPSCPCRASPQWDLA